MFRKALKGICLMLAVLISFSGCTGNKSGGSNSSDESAEISVMVYDRGEVAASEGTYDNNRWTEYINKETGLNIKYVPVPRNEVQQKLSTLFAAGDAPDIIPEFSSDLIATFVNQGVLQPVGDYIEEYSTSYKKYLQENPELLPYITYDNEIYALANKRPLDTIVNCGYWIRQDWLDALGLEMPTSDEELIEVAKQFRDRDPDGNGLDDTLGLSIMLWHENLGTMYYASTIWYVEDDGRLVYGNLVDRFVDSLAFFKTLYDEKLIDEEFITDKNFQKQKQLWVTGKSGILANQWWTEGFNSELLKNNPDARPEPMEPISTKYGRNAFYQEGIAERYVAFNKDMKNPKGAIKFLDWMFDKGWHALQYGFEGVHYNMEDGVPKTIDFDKFKTEVSYARDYSILNQRTITPDEIVKMAAPDPVSQQLAEQKKKSLEVNSRFEFRRDIAYNPTIPEVSTIMSQYVPKRDEIRMKVVVGGEEFTPEWGMEQLRAEWARMGGAEVDRLVNEWYKENEQSLIIAK